MCLARGHLLPLLLHLCVISVAEDVIQFNLGILHPFTLAPEPFAAAVAFDLDFRKNYDVEIRNRFGPPIINVSGLDGRLQIRPFLGTTHSIPSVGVRAALDWFLDNSVVGVVGAQYSSVSIPISSNAAVFQVPMISHASTSPALSDKAEHPYFLRTAIPDTFTASAQWAWMQFFEVPSVAYVYATEPYGEGLFNAFFNIALLAGQTYRVNGIGLEYEPTGLILQPSTDALTRLRTLGNRFVIMVCAKVQFNVFMYVLEMEGSDNTYQWLFGENQHLLTQLYKPSADPESAYAFEAKPFGPKFPAFQDLWSNLTLDDVYGIEAVDRYRLDHFQVPLDSDQVTQRLTEEDLADVEGIGSLSSFMFDACYAYVFAINGLLQSGTNPADIKGEALLNELQQVSFEGVSGSIAFNAQGDRLGSYILTNTQQQIRKEIGIYDSITGELTLHSDPLWIDGNHSRYPPSWLYECQAGFEKNRQTSVCEPCRKGIGCGYQAEVGFPLGILGPLTSVSQEYLATAALFDLDFRKNGDAELRARFGPPIFNITNLDPRLRFKVQIGTSNSQPEVGVNTALDWLQGNGDFYRVAGIAGGFHSAVSTPVSSLATVFEVPMVSWASSSPALSDKNAHPYFSRTAPSDAIQGSAIWAWMTHFGVPSAAFVYTMEPYGSGLYGFVNDIAIAQNKGSRIQGVAVVHQPSSYDLQVARDACERIRETGSRFIILGMSGIEANAFMYVMEEEDMLHGGFQLFGSESVTFFTHAAIKPSKGMPIGFQQFQPVTRGLLYPAFQEMFQQLTLDDFYGDDAIERYMLDRMQVQLDEASAPSLRATDLSDPIGGIGTWNPFLIDAAYTFVVAINNLLRQGIEPTEIYGGVLLDEVRRTEFEGVSGLVKFDTSGDRPSKFTLWNVQAAAGDADGNSSLGNSSLALVQVAFFDASSDMLVLDPNLSLYWSGGIRSVGAPEELLSCNPGFEWNLNQEACTLCPAGWFSAGGRAACEACPPGTTMSQGTSQTCVTCNAGTYSAYGDANCTACAKGTFSAADGQSACDTCPVGRFGPEVGLSMCTRCSGERVSTLVVIEVNGANEYTYTTGAISNSSCGCDRGSRPNAVGGCLPCGEGLICKGLDGVFVEEGFYSAPDFSVYRCYGDGRRCTGGEPGRTCARGRRGIACADCQDGMRPGGDGGCIDCARGDILNTLIIGCIVLIALMGAYFAIHKQNRAVQSQGFVLCAIAGGQFITITQTLSVVNMISLAIEAPFRNILDALGSITFDVGLLRMSCLGASDPVAKYTAKIAMIFMALTAVVVLHCIFVVLFHSCAFGARKPALYGTLGTVCMVFYISVTSTVLEPLQCLQHPNGKWTMRSHPGVLCWETDDHTVMAVLGLVAFVAVPVAVAVAIVAIVAQYPSRMNAGDIDFLKSFSFLFFRYQPQRYWFVLVQFLRSLLVALVLLIPVVTIQVLVLQLIILACLLLTIRAAPWRGYGSNILDCMCGAMMLMMSCIIAQFIEDQDRKSHLMGFLGAGVAVTIIAVVMTTVAYGMYCRFGPRRKPYDFFLCHHKAGAGAFARLLKIMLLDTRQLKADVFVDSDNLENLDALFGYVCSDTSNLVVLASSAVFTRPWCVGEMCTARLASVPTMVVAMHDVELPDDDFVQQLPQRVSNMEVLTESGMELEMLRETMRWVRSLSQYPLPQEMTLSVLARFARCLISGDQRQLEAPPGYVSSRHIQASTAAILCDTGSSEAVAGSIVLLTMLMKFMATASQHIPCLLGQDHDLPEDLDRCVVMCTAACLDRQSFLEVLLQIQARFAAVTLYPVLAEAFFRVPGNDQLQGWVKQPPTPALSSDEAARLVEVVRRLFKGIATSFQPHHASEAVLMVGAREIARHLQTTVKHSKATADRSEAGASSCNALAKAVDDKDEPEVSLQAESTEWLVLGV